ncbi:MAG: hypothetical protein AAFN10_19020 [Bacteroidota bacterium]
MIDVNTSLPSDKKITLNTDIMPTPYVIQDFNKDLQGWITNRFLPTIPDVEGGWEYWIQIDFIAFIDAIYKIQFDFRREVPIDGGRLDWLINSNTQDAVPYAVEIKAQTPKYLAAKLLKDVADDIKKLESLGPKYRRIMLVAIIDQDTQEQLVAKRPFEAVAKSPTMTLFRLDIA